MPNNQEIVIHRITASFLSVYLTLVSVIQAGVFGFLLWDLTDKLDDLDCSRSLCLLTTVLILIVTWHEYMMGATIFRWIPHLRDSIIPFCIGLAEYGTAYYSTRSLPYWFLCVSAFCFMGWFAFHNMFTSARRHLENRWALRTLAGLTGLAQLWAFAEGVIFLVFGLLLLHLKMPSRLTEYVFLSIALLSITGFMVRSIPYWNRILSSTHRRNR